MKKACRPRRVDRPFLCAPVGFRRARYEVALRERACRPMPEPQSARPEAEEEKGAGSGTASTRSKTIASMRSSGQPLLGDGAGGSIDRYEVCRSRSLKVVVDPEQNVGFVNASG